MTPERWREVRRLFDAASELEGDQRIKFLARSCAGSESLLADVESLLRSHEAAGSFIEEPLVNLAIAAGDDSESAAPLRRIGSYAVERTLGQGGMATVYLASRADDEYQRQVAIKVLRCGLDSEDWIRRFRSERQILADLDHPNIARLIEGGTLGDGRPYLVMEYVDGEPLDRDCDARGLSVSRRLDLFNKVCGAVQFAHQRLIVHRDLKPGNILITASGEPKLLDFGIAKLLRPEDFPQTPAMTRPGLRPMTLPYASPEQAAGGSMTTASDVYSLGVVLYEILTGRPPYPTSETNLARAIYEQEPARPSMVVQSAVETNGPDGRSERIPAAIAALRDADPGRLGRILRGDLDNIVLKALRKAPQRRYASAEALSQDIERYLSHRPVQARPDTLVYRGRKFIRRHRWGVAAALVAAVTLIIFVGVLVVQRDRFLQQKTRAEEVTRVMIDLFEVSDPDLARGMNVTAREVMDRGAADLPDRLRDQPELLAEMLKTIGRVYRKLGNYDEAARLLEDAVVLSRQVYGAGHPAMASSLLEHGDLLVLLGDYDLARSRFSEALSLLGSDRQRYGREIEKGLSGLAEASQRLGLFGDAEALHGEALELARQLFGANGERTAVTLRKVGNFHLERGEYSAAKAAYLEGLEIYRGLYGDDHPEVAGLINNLGVVHHKEGNYDRAAELFHETLAIHRRIYDGVHPSLVTVQVNLADLLQDQGLHKEAERIAAEALPYRRKVYGADHPRVGETLNLLGKIRRSLGDLDGAEAHFRGALAITEQLGEGHSQVAPILTNLGLVLRAKGQMIDAEALLRRALKLTRSAFGDEHRRVATILHNLGFLLRSRGELEEAEEYYRDALLLRRRLLGDEHPEVAETTHNLAVVLRTRGDFPAAEENYRAALSLYRARLGDEHQNVALVMQNLAAVLTLQDKAEEAEALARQAVETLEAALPAGHLWTLAARSVLGESLTRQGHYEEAEAALLESYAGQRAAQGDQGSLTVKTRGRLVALYEAWGKVKKAEEYRALPSR